MPQSGRSDPSRQHGEPNTYGYDENGKRRKFANYRPRISMQTIMDVWKRDSFVGEDGKRYVVVKEPYKKVVTVDIVDGQRVEKTEWLTRKVRITWDGMSDRSKLWHMGHIRDHEYRHIYDQYMRGELNVSKFTPARQEKFNAYMMKKLGLDAEKGEKVPDHYLKDQDSILEFEMNDPDNFEVQHWKYNVLHLGEGAK